MMQMRSGTKPSPEAGPSLSGRFTVLSGAVNSYLYVPELQKLYALSDTLAQNLASREIDPVMIGGNLSNISTESQDALNFVTSIVSGDSSLPLSTSRHSHKHLRDLVLHISQKCNLNCSYCYAVELNKAKTVMTLDVARSVLEKTMELAIDGLASVKFLGGEPTFAWDLAEWFMAHYIQAHRGKGLPEPRFTTVTNGTLVTDRIVASAAAYQMYVLVSIDGDQAIHDLLRPTKGGKGTYGKAAASLKQFSAAGVNVAVESVYTRAHYERGITPQDMIDHFLGLGVREFAIAPTVGVWHGCDTIDQCEKIALQFEMAARKSVRSFGTDRPYLLRGIQFVMDGFSLRERRAHVCGAGRTFMAINHDGEAFPCYLLQSPTSSYGHIGRDWSSDRHRSISQRFWENGKQYHPVCRSCWANEICQSCLGTSWQITPEISKPPAWFCGFQKRLIAGVLAEIADLAQSERWPLFIGNIRSYLSPLEV